MNTLLENPLPILAVGAVLATLFGLIFLSRRNLPSLVGLGAVVLFTSLLLITEQLIVTPREEVEQSLSGIVDVMKSNDLSEMLNLLDPNGEAVRMDAEILMARINVDYAGATAVATEVDLSSSPPKATTHFKGRLRGVDRKSGVAVFYSDEIELRWVKRDDRWLLLDYTAYQKGKPLDAVMNHLRVKRPNGNSDR